MAVQACGTFAGRAAAAPLAAGAAVFHDNTTWRTPQGCAFRQLPDAVPALAPLYSNAELSFNALPFADWASDNWWLAWAICGAYLLFCHWGSKAMSTRPAFNLKGPLGYWNMLLAVFSGLGFLRTAPHLLYFLYERGFYSSVSRCACGRCPHALRGCRRFARRRPLMPRAGGVRVHGRGWALARSAHVHDAVCWCMCTCAGPQGLCGLRRRRAVQRPGISLCRRKLMSAQVMLPRIP
jgi:hypothetical protein